MNNKETLPEGWVLTKVRDVLEFNYGKNLPKSKRDAKGKYPIYGSNGIVGYHSSYFVKNPAIIVGRKGASGKVHLSEKPFWPIDTTYYIEPPNGTDIKFFTYQFRNMRLDTLDKSTAIPSLVRDDVYSCNINLAPPPEQHRIVSKIDELFTKLDAGVETLKKAKALLNQYRQAVLKSAFEGKFVNSEYKTTEWKQLSLKDAISESMIGLVRNKASQNTQGSGIPYVKMNNINLRGDVDVEHVVYIHANEDEQKKYKLRNGDILFNTRNSYELVGKTGIVRDSSKVRVFNNNIMRIRLKDNANPQFVCYQMNSPKFREKLKAGKRATTNVCAIYAKDLLPIKITLPNLELQNQIVNKIDYHLSITSQLDKDINEQLVLTERQRSAILQKAFKGQLVPQDPSDEPASKLLERIKAEREAAKLQAKEKRITRKKPRK